MGHHSDEHDPEMQENFRRFREDVEKRTQEELQDRVARQHHQEAMERHYAEESFKREPFTPLTEKDKGEIGFDVMADEGKVIVKFEKPITWIGFDTDQSMKAARLLIQATQVALRQK